MHALFHLFPTPFGSVPGHGRLGEWVSLFLTSVVPRERRIGRSVDPHPRLGTHTFLAATVDGYLYACVIPLNSLTERHHKNIFPKYGKTIISNFPKSVESTKRASFNQERRKSPTQKEKTEQTLHNHLFPRIFLIKVNSWRTLFCHLPSLYSSSDLLRTGPHSDNRSFPALCGVL